MGKGGTVRTNNVFFSMDKLQKIYYSTKIDMIPGFQEGEKEGRRGEAFRVSL